LQFCFFYKRIMFCIYKKEIAAFFSNATGYVVIGIFLLLTGLFLWIVPGVYNVLEGGYASADGLFELAPWLFLFLCPALCMRLFAEEKQNGTWELLVTKPLSATQIVLGKYFAALTVVLLALLPATLYFFTIGYIAEPIWNIDTGKFWGSFIGLVLLAAIYVSVGTFAAAVTRSQIAAFVNGAALCFFLFYGLDLLSAFFSGGRQIALIADMGIRAHYVSVSRGVLDSRDLAYSLLPVIVFLALAVRRCTRKNRG